MEFVVALKNLDLGVPVQGTQRVLDYALELKAAAAASVLLGLRLTKTMRVLFLGRDAAGKTLLRKQMQGRPYERVPTPFVEIDSDWSVNGMQLLAWDFGGLAGYQGTQELFLGEEVRADAMTVAVLCVDVRQQDADALRALVLRSMGGLCQGGGGGGVKLTVALVGTHCDAVEDARQACATLAAHFQAATESEPSLAGRLSLLRDGEELVWLRREPDVQCVQRLCSAIVEHGQQAGATRAAAATATTGRTLHDTLALAAALSKHKPPGVALVRDLGEENAALRDDLAQLHASGLVFCRPGARTVCTNLSVPLELLKALARHQYASCEPAECSEVGWLWNSKSGLYIEHNELWDAGTKARRLTLRGAHVTSLMVAPPTAQGLEFTLVPRDGQPLTLRFAKTEQGKRFLACLVLNRMEKASFAYKISDSRVRAELERLFAGAPEGRALALLVLLSNAILVRYHCTTVLDVHGKPLLDAQGMLRLEPQYLMPCLFPATSGVKALHWDECDARHARKYVVAKGASRLQMQHAVLALAAVLGDSVVDERFWRDDWNPAQPAGAWQSSGTRQVFFECRLSPDTGQWCMYVLLGVCSAKSESGLTQLIVGAHRALLRWCRDAGCTLDSVWVATRADAATPELASTYQGLESGACSLVQVAEVTAKDVPWLVPERSGTAERLRAADEARDALCIWCASIRSTPKQAACKHAWSLSAGRYVAVALLHAAPGRCHVLAARDKKGGTLCAIKVAPLAACLRERNALGRLQAAKFSGRMRTVRLLGTDDSHGVLGATIMELLTGPSMEGLHFQDERSHRVDEARLARGFLRPVCEALQQLHALGLWHLALCPAHLMRASDAPDADLVLLQLSSCVMDADGRPKQLSQGSPWAAPELHNGIGPTATSDVYGVGAMAVQLALALSDQHLAWMRDDGSDLLLLLRGAGVSEALCLLLQRMCHADPQQRPSFEAVCKDPACQ